MSILFYALLCFIVFYSIANLSYKFNLVDVPNKRKDHKNPTAYTGGLAISLILLFALQFFDIFNILDRKINLIISTAFLISIVGLLDDKYDLNVGGKLSLQIIPIFYLITFENINLEQIGDYDYFQLELGVFNSPFTIICVLFLINSFNYFDGLDGTLGIATMSVIFILFFLFIDNNFQLLFILLMVPLSIFLLFNFSFFKLPKLFLGNGGSLFLGFVISFILIYLNGLKITHPILIAWSVSIFVFEFLSINLIRLKNNKDPFKPGKDHLHYLLLQKTKSLFFSNLVIFIINLILFSIGYICYNFFGSLISLISLILLFTIYFTLRNKYSKKLVSL